MNKIIYVLIQDPCLQIGEEISFLELMEKLEEKGLVLKFRKISNESFPLGTSLSSLVELKQFYIETDLNKIDLEISTFRETFQERVDKTNKEFADALDMLQLSAEFFLFRILTPFPEELVNILNEKQIPVGVLTNKF